MSSDWETRLLRQPEHAFDTEQAVKALPVFLQRRMAHLVLSGWVITKDGGSYPSWSARHAMTATHPVACKKLYASSTLLTLLTQMVGVVEDMEAGVYERMALVPDAAKLPRR